jgi:hypothetical protein
VIDRQRAVSVFGISLLVFSLFAVGFPVPSLEQEGTTNPAEFDGATNYDVTMTMTDGYMTQDARAILPAVVVGAVALSAGTAGTVIGKKYFSADSGNQGTAYYSAKSLENRIQTDYSTLNSSVEETRTMMYRVAETSFAEKMANGSSKATAKAYANNEVEDYLSGILEDEFYRRNNAYMSAAHAYNSASGVTFFVESSTQASGTTNSSVTLPNGNSTEMVSSNGINMFNLVFIQDWQIQTDNSDYPDYSFGGIPKEGWKNLKNRYLSLETEVDSEITNFSNSVSKSQYENLSADEIVSPVNQALEWGESYNDTGSSGYASALASSLGYDVAETGTMYHVKMPDDSSTWYNGTVYADESTLPNQTIETGKIYNGSDTTAYVATSSGTTTLNEDWKVVSIESRTGESLSKTNLSTWSRDSLNATAPLATLKEWQKEVNTGGSGGGLFGGSSSSMLAIIAALLGAGFLLASRSGDDGNGGNGGGDTYKIG